jgi:WD40 repeat protein
MLFLLCEDFNFELIKNVSMKVKTKLKGHQKRITGLAFSHVLNVLVSSGADSQVKNFKLAAFYPIAFPKAKSHL